MVSYILRLKWGRKWGSGPAHGAPARRYERLPGTCHKPGSKEEPTYDQTNE
jgi:hypothetical protein